jgi:hypothetical protein
MHLDGHLDGHFVLAATLVEKGQEIYIAIFFVLAAAIAMNYDIL